MKLYFDTRLGYLVTAPGQETALTGFSLKVGDTSTIDIEFGKSADPSGTPSFISGSTWTKEQLTGGSNITIGFKEDGDYADGTLLAGSSSFSYSDYVYTFSVSLNTTALNTAFARDDADDTNDIATLATSFEVTYQPGGSGGWLSSILPVTATIYNDVLLGDESSPATATDPDEYLLKQDGIRWLSTVTSKIGGTAADLDSIATVSLDVGTRVQFSDEDGASPILVDYKLEAGTDAESSPDVIRPDDYDGSTNAKVWKRVSSSSNGNFYTTNTNITGLTGGASSALDSINTSSLQIGDIYSVVDANGFELVYRLESGTLSNSSPWIIRGTDYAATTNERFWRLIAPWTTLSLNVFGIQEEISLGQHFFAFSNSEMLVKEVRLDIAQLPSGTGTGSIEWNIDIGGSDLFSSNVTQSARTWAAVSDEGVSIQPSGKISEGTEMKLKIIDLGGIVPPEGAVVHIRHLYSSI